MASNDNPWADQEPTTNRPSGHLGGATQQVGSAQDHWQLAGSNQGGYQQQQQQQQQQQHHPAYTAPSDPWSQQQGQQSQMHYSAPPGPPPSHAQTAPRLPARLPDETAPFVPAAERGEQREALEHFEMSRHQPLSSDDQNIERLTQEFPGIDSALVAAIYGDSKDMGASREMLGELADQMKADGR